MSILPIVIYPDKRLTTKSNTVNVFDQNLKKELKDMLDSMYEYEGIGLAAVQVGIMKSMFVMDLTSSDEIKSEENMTDKVYFIVNPVIKEVNSELFEFKGGCLSFPDQKVNIYRPKTIILQYQDENGNSFIKTLQGLAAICVQHETDHTNGIVMPDRVRSNLQKQMIIKKAIKHKF